MPKVSKTSTAVGGHVPIGIRNRRSAWDMTQTVSVLLYGRSATGKTTFWSTFPKPILALVCSGGSKPGELRSINTPELRKQIVPIVIEQSSDVKDILDEVSAVNPFPYGTVVLEHATGLQDLVLKEILDLDEIPVQKTWGMATQQQYGQCAIRCKELFRAILNLSCHRVVVAQEREFNVDVDTEVLAPYVGAGLMPSLTGWLNPACDMIVQTFIRRLVEEKEVKVGDKTVPIKSYGKQVEYCLRTGPDPTYTTKFRVPRGSKVPEVIVDPTFDKVMKVIGAV